MFVLRKKYGEPESDTHYWSAIHSTLLRPYSKMALGYALFIVSPSLFSFFFLWYYLDISIVCAVCV